MNDVEALLQEVRTDIDDIDHKLLELFIKRMKCSERVAEIKGRNGLPVFNEAREQAIIDWVKGRAGPYGGAAASLYSSIMAVSRERQYQMLNEEDEVKSLIKNSPAALDTKGKKIVCQGVSGAYSHKAARMFLGKTRMFPLPLSLATFLKPWRKAPGISAWFPWRIQRPVRFLRCTG